MDEEYILLHWPDNPANDLWGIVEGEVVCVTSYPTLPEAKSHAVSNDYILKVIEIVDKTQ